MDRAYAAAGMAGSPLGVPAGRELAEVEGLGCLCRCPACSVGLCLCVRNSTDTALNAWLGRAEPALQVPPAGRTAAHSRPGVQAVVVSGRDPPGLRHSPHDDGLAPRSVRIVGLTRAATDQMNPVGGCRRVPSRMPSGWRRHPPGPPVGDVFGSARSHVEQVVTWTASRATSPVSRNPNFARTRRDARFQPGDVPTASPSVTLTLRVPIPGGDWRAPPV